MKRFPTHPDRRDLEGYAARRERERSGTPEPVQDEITGRYQGDDLRMARRSKRTTDERIERLEDKHDKLDDKLDVQSEILAQVRVAVGTVSGKLEVLPELVEVVKGMASTAVQRDHVSFTARVDVDKAREEAKIEVEKTAEIDKIKAQSEKRKRVTKLITMILAALGSGGFLHWLFSHL